MKKLMCLLLLVTMVFLTGCGGQEAGKSDKKLASLSIGLMPDTDSLPFIIAQEKGYFNDEGVTVEIQQFKSAMDRDAALQSGNLDGAVSDLLAVAFAKSGGFDVKAAARTDGSYKLIAGKDEPAQSVKELKGKDVSVSRNTIIEYVTDQILDKEQMTESDINKVIIPQIPTRLEMLQNGQLAAATLPEPMGSIAVHNGCRFLVGSDELGINPGVIVMTTKSLENKQSSLQAFYRAYNRAVKYLNETPREEYIDLILEKGGFPPAARDALVLPKYKEIAPPERSDVTAVMEWLNTKGLVKEKYTYEDLVYDKH